MEKRTKLALVIIVALILLIIGLYFLFYPFLQSGTNQQPPALPSTVTPYVPPPGQTNPGAPAATGTAAVPPTSNTLVTLQNEAMATVERIGSGTSIDGFQGYDDVLLQMTTAGRSALTTEQQALVQAHPAGGPTFGLSTHAVSASVTSGAAGDPTIVIKVQALQAQDNGNPGTPTKTTGKSVSVTFAKQSDGSYLIDSMAWADVAL